MKNVEIFENVTAKRPLRQTVFFRAKTIFKVAVIKTKGATIAFFSSPLFFLLALFSFSFSFFSVLLQLIGPKSLPFEAFSLKWLQRSVGWFLKIS